MKLSEAASVAKNIKDDLAPYCERIEIAGSVRRMKPEVKDIEIVCIPKPYQTGLFEDGIASVINKWEKVKGDLPCKYTQRIVGYELLTKSGWDEPKKCTVDIFFAVPENWGYIFAIRTGSAEFSHNVLAKKWVSLGYKGEEGFLHDSHGKRVNVYEEESLFRMLGLKYIEPQKRN
jgi:DNA polymerase/3'-5' exonuclease PolX